MNSYVQQWLDQKDPMWTPVTPIYPKIDQKASVDKGYVNNADVYSIISRKAQMASGIPFYVYKIKGEEGKKWLREYKALTSGEVVSSEAVAKSQIYKVKALQEVDDSNPINILLQRPNPGESQTEFLEKCYGFLDITGNSYIWKESLSMGANQGVPKALYTIPSQYTTIVPDGTFPVSIAGYMFFLWGEMGLKKEEVIHLKYFNPDYQPDGSHLMGMPPLRAGAKTLARSDSEEDSATAQFQHGGPAGMIYNESIQPDDQSNLQVGALKKKWEAETWGNKNRGKILFSAGKLGYIQTGLSPVDMDLIESGSMTFRKLCRIFKMPSAIFNDNEHATMNNMEQFYKAAYTDGVIPMVIKMRDALNAFLLPDFGDSGEYFIDADFSNIPVLQQDMKTLTDWLDKSWEITPNERRELKKFGRSSDPNMDKVWMPGNLETMESLAMPIEDISADVDALDKAKLNPYR
ncbi:hypothetical protein MMC2321_01922 [Chitinophaga sp. MM2321]